MNTDYCGRSVDYGPYPYVVNVAQRAIQNGNYRTTLWTGACLQMTLMNIPVKSDIGLEIHEEADQLIRIEQGTALVRMGNHQTCLDFQQKVFLGDTIFVPTGTWHNVTNVGSTPLKLSVIYAPPQHPAGTLHVTKAVAENEE